MQRKKGKEKKNEECEFGIIAMNFNKCISAKNRLQNGNLSEIHLCVDGKVKTKAETANYSTAIRAVSVPGETVLERWAEKSHLSEEKAEGGKALYWGSSVEAAVCSKQGKYRWGEGRGGEGFVRLFANPVTVYLENPGTCGRLFEPRRGSGSFPGAVTNTEKWSR